MAEILGEALAINMAYERAASAAQKYLEENGDQQYPCGFAWVIIKPNRGPLVKTLLKMGLATPSDGGGVRVPNPSRNYTQCMDAKEMGAYAFADFLSPLYPEYKIYAMSRID